jgi:hypothetical protein
MTKKIQIFQVRTAVAFDQLDEAGQLGFVGRLASFAAATQLDFRLLSFVRPWQAERWRNLRSKLAQRAPHTWQRRGIQEELRLGQTITSRLDLKSIRHYLVLYGFAGSAGDLRQWGIEAQPAYPPLPLEGVYAAHLDHLWPVKEGAVGQMVGGRLVGGQAVSDRAAADPKRPYARILAAYEFKDKWDWINPLADLLYRATGPMVLCLDAQRIGQRAIEFATNSLQAALSEVTRVSDKETVLNMEDADYIMTATTRGAGLHNTRLALMLLDSDPKRLRQRTDRTRTRLSPFMKITQLSGAQEKAALLFSPVQHPPGIPDIYHNVLSNGVGHMLGVMGHASDVQYAGIYMGVGRSHGGGVTGLEYINPWQGQEAAHLLCLGKTGYGKTVAMQAYCARQAELGAQVIFLEPQGHSARLYNYLGPHNALFNRVSYSDITYNPLDVVAPTFADQFDYFVVLLEFLLNPKGDDPHRPKRYLSNREMAAVNEALKKAYAGYDWEELLRDQSKTPLLELFVRWLAKMPGGDVLADELDRLYVQGPWAETFNATSTLQVRLKRPDGSLWPAVIYDLSKVSKTRRPLFYFVILASINRESRRPLPLGGDRPRRLCVIDEFRYLTGGTNLTEWVADQVATSRSFRVAYCLIDQNPRTLAGVSADGAQVVGNADDLTSRQHMLDNIRYSLFFHLDPNAIKVLRTLYPHLTESHFAFLQEAQAGQALLTDGDRIKLIDMVLRASEQRHFLGS